MAEAGDSFTTLLQTNTTELLNLFDGESLTDMFQGISGKGDPHLEILEQPKQRGFRFRYSCEGPSHGGLPGENSAKGRKSFPSVQINNYYGKARIEVTLVTLTDPPEPHAHSLVGKNVVEGACVVEVGPECGMTASFPNLGIQHVTKKNVKIVLRERYLKRHKLEKSVAFNTIGEDQAMNIDVNTKESDEATVDGITKEELAKVDQKVEQEAKNMNLSTVRLCFQTYVQNDQGHFVNALEPVYSNPIFDSKAASASELKICRIDKQSGFVQGGEEIFLLCDKVQKDDIEVRFYENPEDENMKPWEDFGKFSTSDVHRQFAIVFKTPPYWNVAIEKPVQVYMELRRKSDKERSAPMMFTYKPQEFDAEQIGAKRRKKVPHFSEIEQTVTSTAQGSDPGAGPSRSEASTNPAAFLNPLIFNPYLAGGTPFPGLSFPPLFSGGFNPSGSFASGTSFGGVGGAAASVPFPTGDEEPSTSNLS